MVPGGAPCRSSMTQLLSPRICGSRLGRTPRPRVCPECRIGKPHKHGFYKRFYLDGFSCRLILIRRYYCSRCGATISFLPSFCIPKFQYSLHFLWKVLRLRLEKGLTLRDCLQRLLNTFPELWVGCPRESAFTPNGSWPTYLAGGSAQKRPPRY